MTSYNSFRDEHLSRVLPARFAKDSSATDARQFRQPYVEKTKSGRNSSIICTARRPSLPSPMMSSQSTSTRSHSTCGARAAHPQLSAHVLSYRSTTLFRVIVTLATVPLTPDTTMSGGVEVEPPGRVAEDDGDVSERSLRSNRNAFTVRMFVRLSVREFD